MRVKVKQDCKAFWKGNRLKAGDVFILEDGEPFSDKWMIKLEDPEPEVESEVEKPKAKRTRKRQSKTVDSSEK